MIRFTVYGTPQTAGSKRSFVPLDKVTKKPFRRAGGGVVVSTVDANPKSGDWKNLIASEAAKHVSGTLLDGPLVVTITFYRVRPKGHFRGGVNSSMLKPSAPPYPDVKPDVLKLARAVEDAMSGVLYRDDSQIVKEWLEKEWGETSRVEVSVWPIAEWLSRQQVPDVRLSHCD